MSYEQEQEQENCKKRDTFDEQLKCLRGELLTSQSTLQKADIEIKEREAQIEALGAFIGEFDQIIADYKEALPALLEKQCNYEKICNDETNCLESILGEECAQEVCCIVKTINDEITDLEENIRKREEELKYEIKKREGYKKKRDEAKGNFDQWKDPKKSIESRFKLLDQLKKVIDTEHDKHHNTIAYYLLKCKDKFCPIAEKGEPKVYKLGGFINVLECAWENYVKADSCFNEQDAIVKGFEKQLETRKAQLETDKKNLEARIRRKLIQLANSDKCSKTESNNCTQT